MAEESAMMERPQEVLADPAPAATTVPTQENTAPAVIDVAGGTPGADKLPAPPKPDPIAIAAEARQSRVQEIGRSIAAMPPIPEPPPIAPAPDRPHYYPVDNLQTFGSLASALGVLVSLKSRRPLVNALTAASAAMNGYQEGNLERYKMSVQEWKDNTDKFLAETKANSDRYNQILHARNMTLQEKEIQLRTEAIARQDDHMLMQLREHGIDRAQQMLIHREALAGRLQVAAERQQQHAQEQALKPDNILMNDVNRTLSGIRAPGSDNSSEAYRMWHELRAPEGTQQKVKNEISIFTSAQNTVADIYNVMNEAKARGIPVSGLLGKGNIALEAIQSGMSSLGLRDNPGDAYAQRFRGLVATLQSQIPELLKSTSRMDAQTRARIDDIVKGLGTLTTPDAVVHQMQTLERIIAERIPRPLGAPNGTVFGRDPSDNSYGFFAQRADGNWIRVK